MLLPLEYSMTLWWVATPQWGLEPDLDASASSAELIDSSGTPGSAEPTDTGAPSDDTAPDEPPPVVVSTAVPMREVLIGYSWSAEPHWAQVLGLLYERFATNQRHAAQRLQNGRAAELAALARNGRPDEPLRDRAGAVGEPRQFARSRRP